VFVKITLSEDRRIFCSAEMIDFMEVRVA